MTHPHVIDNLVEPAQRGSIFPGNKVDSSLAFDEKGEKKCVPEKKCWDFPRGKLSGCLALSSFRSQSLLHNDAQESFAPAVKLPGVHVRALGILREVPLVSWQRKNCEREESDGVKRGGNDNQASGRMWGGYDWWQKRACKRVKPTF